MSQVFRVLQQVGINVSEQDGAAAPLAPTGGRARAGLTQYAPEFVRLVLAIEALKTEDRPFALQFVAATPSEGTSTVAANFASVSAVERGKPVLLVDCNGDGAQEPASSLPTLVEGYRDGASLRARLIQTGRDMSGATAVRLGDSRHPMFDVDPAELQRVMWRAREEFAITVLDCPAITSDPQSAALSRFCDGTVLVIQAEGVRKQVVQAAKREIERHGGQVIGVVLNRRRFYIPDWVYNKL